MSSIYSTHPLIRKIQSTINQLTNEQQFSIKFIWIPSHVGITGNEIIDRAAKDASQLDQANANVTITHIHINTHIKNQITSNWKAYWNAQINNKLLQIKTTVLPWQSSFRTSRREEIIITRLRIGHTRATHGHLFTGEPPPVCHLCDSSLLTVEHILSECTETEPYRRIVSLPNTLRESLQDDVSNCDKIIMLLNRIDFLSNI